MGRGLGKRSAPPPIFYLLSDGNGIFWCIYIGVNFYKTASLEPPPLFAGVDVDDIIAFSCSLFSDKVDNTDGLNQMQMDAFGCMVQGSFLTYM